MGMNVPIQEQRPQPRLGCNFGSDHSQGSSLLHPPQGLWRTGRNLGLKVAIPLGLFTARGGLAMKLREFRIVLPQGWPQPQGGSVLQPKVARDELPWENIGDEITTPTGLRPPAQSCEERATLGRSEERRVGKECR